MSAEALPLIEPGMCRSGEHPQTPENVYVNPLTGRRQCRLCHASRRAQLKALRSAGQDLPPRPLRTIGRELSPEELAELRAKVACHGCGAVRVDRPNALRAPFTTIRHLTSCPVRGIREGSDLGVT